MPRSTAVVCAARARRGAPPAVSPSACASSIDGPGIAMMPLAVIGQPDRGELSFVLRRERAVQRVTGQRSSWRSTGCGRGGSDRDVMPACLQADREVGARRLRLGADMRAGHPAHPSTAPRKSGCSTAGTRARRKHIGDAVEALNAHLGLLPAAQCGTFSKLDIDPPEKIIEPDHIRNALTSTNTAAQTRTFSSGDHPTLCSTNASPLVS
jgi:hypothetical protein